MKLTMFPRMLVSHDEGWEWLMRVHPSVVKMFFFYAVPMSLLPVAMLLHAADTYRGRMMLGNIGMEEAWWLCALLFLAELIMVPLMAEIIRRIGGMVQREPEYHDAFAFAAIAPTPLWLASLGLFLPSLAFNALVTGVALCLAVVLIYEGSVRVFGLRDDAKLPLLTGSIVAAGLIAWAVLTGLMLVSWERLIA